MGKRRPFDVFAGALDVYVMDEVLALRFAYFCFAYF